MFKTRIILIALLAISNLVTAQDGLRIGPNAMFLSSRPYVIESLPDEFNFRFKSGYSGGLSIQYGFTQKFILGSGVNFTSKGYRVFNDTNSGGSLIKHNFNNIEVPINAIFKLRLGSTSKMRGIIGGTFNYMISKEDKVMKNNTGTFVISEKSVTNMYPMLNLGVEIASENKGGNIFVFGVYYKQAFSDQHNLSIYNTSDLSQNKLFNLAYRGTYIGVGLSYLFDIKNFKRSEEFFY